MNRTKHIFASLLGLFVASTAWAAEPLARVPIRIAGERAMVSVSANGSNDLSFLLDTGYSLTMVHPELAKDLELERGRDITIVGIAGEERAPTYQGVKLNIGAARYEPRRVAALPSENNRRRRRDGILGAGLFRQFVVEIDFTGKQLALYAPTNFQYAGNGEIIPLRFRRGSSTPVIEAALPGTNGALVRGEFELDSGCDSGVCMASDFAARHGLVDQDRTEAGEKVGVGGGAQTRSGYLPQLHLGALRVEKAQTDFFLKGSPADPGLAGHIGAGVLNQFKVIFDYSRRQMILERR